MQTVSAPAPRVAAYAVIPARRQAVVFDTETTGVSGADRVVSLAAIPLDAGLHPSGPVLHLVFNPGRPSHPAARAVHGLADAYLARQPRFADHAEEVRALFRGRVLVAHNLAFDTRMLAQEFAALGALGLAGRGRYCTMLAFRARHAGQPAGLDPVLRHFGLPVRAGAAHGAFHGAFEDAMLAMHVLHRMHGRVAPVQVAPVAFQNAR